MTIEKTGKDVKSMMLFSSFLIAGSVVLFFVNSVPGHEVLGGAGFVVGILMRAYASIVKWWEHD
ncbi:hypothetical protein [Burkholderia glumae]|uniref:hypothetical protein n=1 Tax=Burkholderia glumae TaxID=337 RepID=UPI002151C1E6|nr:hypothetical protein [Burkholderia glumae]